MSTASTERRVEEPWPNLRRLVLSMGCLTLGIGLLFAWDSPATGYELSIYRATPVIFWLGVGGAFAASLLVCAVSARDRLAVYGLGLGGLATLAIAALPLVRSYRFLGAADALTHLGWAADIRAGLLAPHELLYPGGHSATALLGAAFGLSTARAMLLWVFLLFAAYLVCIPIFARAIVGSPVVAVLAGFSGFLFLPFNNVSTVYQFHAYSLGLMAIPVVGYVLVRYLQSDPGPRAGRPDAWHLLLLGVGSVLLLLHPQVTLNVVILLGTFAVVHRLSHRYGPNHPLRDLRSTGVPFLILFVGWSAWSFRHWQAMATVENLATAAYQTILGDQTPGQAAADAGVSAAALGASLTELFLKLFLVSAIYGLIASIVALVAIRSTVRRQHRPDHSVISYVGFGGLVLGPFFVLHFLGDISHHFFRHLGFVMVFATVLGAIGLYYLVDALSAGKGSPALRTVGVWAFAIVLILSVPIVYSSPYIYLPGSHVPDDNFEGYGTAFDIADEEVHWSGVRSGPGRFVDGLTPGERPVEAVRYSADNSSHLIEQANGGSDIPLYLPISERDYAREVLAYQEFRFDRTAFQAPQRSTQANHVHTNGDFDLYYIRPAEED